MMMDGSRLRALCGVVFCITLVACTSKSERIESGLRKGDLYVAALDWDKAGVEARNVLQMDPKNARAYLIAARIEDGKGAYRNAYANYSKALELRPDSIEAKIGLARLYLLSNDLAQAEPMISSVLAVDAQNVRARALGVALLARQGKPAESRAAADQLVQSGVPLPADSSLMIAGLYFNAKAPDAALDVLDKAIAANPRDLRLPQMAAEVASAGNPDDAHVARADGYYAQATAAAPKVDALWRSWAMMHIRRKDTARAEVVLRKAIEVAPDDSARIVALLEFTAAFHDKQQAEKDYLAAIDAHPKDSDLRFALADFYRAQKRPDDAVGVLQAIVDGNRNAPAGVTARGTLATLWLEQGKPEQARAMLAELLKANPRDATGLVLRGRLELADGNARDAVIDLRSAAKDRPGSTEVAALLAQAHHLAGEPQLAREALADAVKFNGDDPRAHLMLAADMAETKEYDAAQSEVDAAIKVDPRSEPARRLKFELALTQGDLVQAQATAVDIETRFAADPTGHLLHGRVLEREKKFAPALAQFDQAARLAPLDAEPQIAAVGLLTAQRQFAEAGRRVDALDKPNPALAWQLRGELALAMGDLARAQASFTQRVDLPAAPTQAYKNLAAVLVERGSLPQALDVLDRGEKAYPADTTLATARAEWLGRAGRIDDAITTYEKILAKAPGNDVAANNLAYVLVESRRDKPSLERALQLANRFASSTQPGYVDTLGLVQYRLGQYDQAAAQLARAALLAPGDAGVQLHYGMALCKKGDVQQGSEIVRKALANKASLPDHDEARALIASI